MITCPISSNLCKTSSLHCYPLYNFPSFRNSHWRCFVRKGVLRNFAKFTGKHLWQSLFFNKVAGWGDCLWSFSCLLLKISCLFHFNRKMKRKKVKYPDGVQIFTFLVEYQFVGIKDFKPNFTDDNLIRKCVSREFDVAVFIVSLEKSFWVVNTWRAPVQKRLKGSILNFAHTFLTDCCTKLFRRFS